MGSRLKIAISMRLASGIYLIVAIGVLLSVADANPGAKPLTVKAHVGVDVNSGENQSSGNTNNRCARQNEGFCFKKGETDCKAPCSGPCCEGLRCDDSSNWRGICISK